MFSFLYIYMISILMQFQSMLLLYHDHKIEYISLFDPFHSIFNWCFISCAIWQTICLVFWCFFTSFHMKTIFSPKNAYISNICKQCQQFQNVARWRRVKLLPDCESKTKNGMKPFWNEKKCWEDLTETVDFLRHDSHVSKRLLVTGPSNKWPGSSLMMIQLIIWRHCIDVKNGTYDTYNNSK